MRLRCRLRIHSWSDYKRPDYIRQCSGCGKSERHPYNPEPRRCPCYLHYRAPMLHANPCICECDHDSPREQYLQTLESMNPGPVLQARIDEVRMTAQRCDLYHGPGGCSDPDCPTRNPAPDRMTAQPQPGGAT